jgi:hypothetical protein
MDALLAGEARVAPLAIKPDRLPTERIEEAGARNPLRDARCAS